MGFRELFAFKFVQGFLTPRNVITQKFFVTVIICISHWALYFVSLRQAPHEHMCPVEQLCIDLSLLLVGSV